MTADSRAIRRILDEFRSEYAAQAPADVDDAWAPITEADLSAEIRHRLTDFCRECGYQVHCEIKPARDGATDPSDTKGLPRIDVVVLADRDGASWFSAAKKLQDQYKKGSIEARFSSVPVRFFHTAIEVKIQSNVGNARKDIDGLNEIRESAPLCNCFFVLFNARGRARDHEQIVAYAKANGIEVVEYRGGAARRAT